MNVADAAAVAVAARHACALLRDGSIKCWGHNGYAQLGDGTTESRPTAVPVADLGRALQLDVAGVFGGASCATQPSGEIACWGYDKFGWAGAPEESLTTPTVVRYMSDAASVWLSGPNCIIETSGRLRCTGYNGSGQLDPDLPQKQINDGELITIDGVTDATQVVSTWRTLCTWLPRRNTSALRSPRGKLLAGAIWG
jgi:alpha-tubulin suppressor-like RCC1 family protein